MLNQQNSVVLFYAFQQLHHALGFYCAHAGQWLVEQHHLRLGCERHGDLQLALLTVADSARDAASAVLQTRQFQGSFSACVYA